MSCPGGPFNNILRIWPTSQLGVVADSSDLMEVGGEQRRSHANGLGRSGSSDLSSDWIAHMWLA